MRFLLIISFYYLLSGLTAQSTINWISFDELPDSLLVNPKPVLVFIYAEWCPYCKLQDRKTFSKSKVIKDLGNYYCLRLNAEEKKDIQFLNRTYQFRRTSYRSGTHELARYLGIFDGGLVLPTSVLLNEKLQVVKKEQGYLDPAYFRRWLVGK